MITSGIPLYFTPVVHLCVMLITDATGNITHAKKKTSGKWQNCEKNKIAAYRGLENHSFHGSLFVCLSFSMCVWHGVFFLFFLSSCGMLFSVRLGCQRKRLEKKPFNASVARKKKVFLCDVSWTKGAKNGWRRRRKRWFLLPLRRCVLEKDFLKSLAFLSRSLD